MSNDQVKLEMDDNIKDAIDTIDKWLGKGYAKQHPELIGAFIQGCATLGLAATIRGLGEYVRSDHPLQGETFRGIEDALGNIANAIGEHASKE
jgi:hypothetical protein